MTDDKKQQTTPKSHVLLWALASAFVVLAIAGMWAVDYYYSPEMLNSSTVPEAVGK